MNTEGAIVFGMRIVEDPYCGKMIREQVRFPRSKRSRMRRKWAKRESNWRTRIEPQAYRMGDVMVVHPMLMDAIQKQLGLHPFVVRKTADQAKNYSVEQLEGIMRKLLETDVSLKTSRLEATLALDMLVVELTA